MGLAAGGCRQKARRAVGGGYGLGHRAPSTGIRLRTSRPMPRFAPVTTAVFPLRAGMAEAGGNSILRLSQWSFAQALVQM